MRPPIALLLLAAVSCAGDPAPRSPAQVRTFGSPVRGACDGHEVPLEPGVTAPKVLERATPSPSVTPAPYSGFACLHATIDATGRAVEIEVVDTSHPLFAKDFARSLEEWRFEPATREGVPVPIRAHFGARFKTDFWTEGPPWPARWP